MQFLLATDHSQEVFTVEPGVIALECIGDFLGGQQHTARKTVVREYLVDFVLNAECFGEEDVVFACHAILL
jgi:hypothetical protein